MSQRSAVPSSAAELFSFPGRNGPHAGSQGPNGPSAAALFASLHAEIDSGKRDVDALLGTIAVAAQFLTGATGAAVAVRRENAFVCIGRSGDTAPPLGATLRVDSGISGECLRTGSAVLCVDTQNDSRVDADVCRGLGLRSIAAVPISAPGEILGLVEIFSTNSDAFVQENMDTLNILAGLAALTVSRRQGTGVPSQPPQSVSVHSPYTAAPTRPAAPSYTPAPTRPAAPSYTAAPTKPAAPPYTAPTRPAAPSYTAGPTKPAAPPYTAPTRPAAPSYTAGPSKPIVPPFTPAPSTPVAPTFTGAPNTMDASPRQVQAPGASPLRKYKGSWVAGSSVAVLVLVGILSWRAWLGAHTPSTPVVEADPLPIAETQSQTVPPAKQPDLPSKPSPVRVSDLTVDRVVRPAAKTEVANDVLREDARNHPTPTVVAKTPPPKASPPTTPTVETSAVSLPPELTATATNPGAVPNLLALSIPRPQLQTSRSVSQGVMPQVLVHKAPLIYPPQARALGLEGTVVMEATITPEGKISNLHPISGNDVLARAAMDSVKQWRYEPALLNGKPTPVQTQITVKFTLPR